MSLWCNFDSVTDRLTPSKIDRLLIMCVSLPRHLFLSRSTCVGWYYKKQVWVQSPNLFSVSSRSALMHRPMRLQLDAVSVTNRLYRHCTIHQTDRRQTCLSLCLYQYPLCCVSWHRNAATRLTIIGLLCVGWSQSDFLLPSSFLLCRFVPAQERLVFALPIASCDSRPDE